MATPLPLAPDAAVMYCKSGAEASAKPRLAMEAIFNVVTILFFAPSYTIIGLSLAGSAAGGSSLAGSAARPLPKRSPEMVLQRRGELLLGASAERRSGARAKHDGARERTRLERAAMRCG